MKGQLTARTPEEYLAQLAEPRRTAMARLDGLIRDTLPQLKRCIVSGMIGYGPLHYRYASGREGDTAKIIIASNAAGISLYALAADDDGWIVERYRSKFPQGIVGKSCIRFKRLEDLNPDALTALLREVEAAPFPSHGGHVKNSSTGTSKPRRTARSASADSRKRAAPSDPNGR